MLWWVWFRKVGLRYNINRTIKAETGRKSSRGKMATYHLTMASRTQTKKGRKSNGKRKNDYKNSIYHKLQRHGCKHG